MLDSESLINKAYVKKRVKDARRPINKKRPDIMLWGVFFCAEVGGG